MIYKMVFGNSTITYTVTRSNRIKTSEIIVDEKGIEVKVPLAKNGHEIRQMVSGKRRWILKKLLEFEDMANKKPPKVKPKTAKYLEESTLKWASKIGVEPSKIIVKNLKSRWGSATKSGVVTLNIEISRAPPEIIDYIIIHELCHLKIPDHSRLFWDLVYTYDGDFESKKRWLEHNFERLLDLPDPK